MYSITQTLSNSLLGDVVLDSYNIVYWDEDSILDQIYEKQICSTFYSEDFEFKRDWKKCIYKEIKLAKTRNS